MDLGTAATGFQVTRLTEASFIVSTPEQDRVKGQTPLHFANNADPFAPDAEP
jgi:hypothetical protein